jgi:hypothetical protein
MKRIDSTLQEKCSIGKATSKETDRTETHERHVTDSEHERHAVRMSQVKEDTSERVGFVSRWNERASVRYHVFVCATDFERGRKSR